MVEAAASVCSVSDVLFARSWAENRKWEMRIHYLTVWMRSWRTPRISLRLHDTQDDDIEAVSLDPRLQNMIAATTCE